MKKNKLKTKKEIHIDYLTGRKLDAGRKLLLHVSRKTIILCNRALRNNNHIKKIDSGPHAVTQ